MIKEAEAMLNKDGEEIDVYQSLDSYLQLSEKHWANKSLKEDQQSKKLLVNSAMPT